MPRRRVAEMILVAIFGDISRLEGFESFTETELTLDAGIARVRVSLDGEVIALEGPLAFRIRRGALRVVVP
jgi:diacylglycerol kinase family enzyme